jgi:hypothetical protein
MLHSVGKESRWSIIVFQVADCERELWCGCQCCESGRLTGELIIFPVIDSEPLIRDQKRANNSNNFSLLLFFTVNFSD